MAGMPGANTHDERGYGGESEPLPLTTAIVTLASLDKRPAESGGDDATPPTRETIAAARQWLTGLSRTVAQAHQPWLDPHVAATPDGDVLFEWWRAERKLSVYVADETAEYITTWKEAGEIRQDDGDAQSTEAQVHLWSWGC